MPITISILVCYLTIALGSATFIAVRLIREEQSMDESDWGATVGLCLCWPLILPCMAVIAAFAAPILGINELGKYDRRRLQVKADNAAIPKAQVVRRKESK